MDALGFLLFETVLGRCGIAWSARGVCCLHLPERSAHATRAYLLARFAGAQEREPSPPVREAIRRVQGLLRGQPDDLLSIALDLEVLPTFQRRVYAAARGIGVGQTASYGELARRIGAPGAARAVGQALGRNPVAIIVPCHRVLAAGGHIGGFSAQGGVTTKRRILLIEREACSAQLPMGF